MRKLFVCFISVMFLLSACAVSGEPLPGEELILAAREEYASLNSAHVEVINDETGEPEQTFIFKYDEKGMMTYSYIGTGEGIYLAQYNNGREQFTNDNGEITAIDVSNLQFTAYYRDVPYPMAGEGLILFYKKAVIAEKSYVQQQNGITTVSHSYDAAKIGDYDGEGKLTAFTVEYRFDENGDLIDLKEVTEVTLDDGKERSHSYTIYISERNAVDRVENVVDISAIED